MTYDELTALIGIQQHKAQRIDQGITAHKQLCPTPSDVQKTERQELESALCEAMVELQRLKRLDKVFYNELDVTELVTKEGYDASQCSGSVAELGEGAGSFTWQNSLNALDNDSELYKTIVANRAKLESHFREFGVWSNSEIKAWEDHEIVALVVQDFSAEFREYQAYEENGEDLEKVTSGRIYQGDDQKWYYHIGV